MCNFCMQNVSQFRIVAMSSIPIISNTDSFLEYDEVPLVWYISYHGNGNKEESFIFEIDDMAVIQDGIVFYGPKVAPKRIPFL